MTSPANRPADGAASPHEPSEAAKVAVARIFCLYGDTYFDWDEPIGGSYGNTEESRASILADAGKALRAAYAIDHAASVSSLRAVERERDALAKWQDRVRASSCCAEARREALEGAARVADDLFDKGFSAYMVAAEIRALSPGAATTESPHQEG